MIWKSVAWGMTLVLVVGGLCVGCRKAAEDEGAAAAERLGNPKREASRGPFGARSKRTGDEAPSKLTRDTGRHADGRKAPAPDPESTQHPVAASIPGKPGFVFSPYTNSPVDVRGLPPGTLVRDPQDPDAKHLFRTPVDAADETEDATDEEQDSADEAEDGADEVEDSADKVEDGADKVEDGADKAEDAADGTLSEIPEPRIPGER